MKPIALVAWLLSYISIASLSAAIITPALPQIQAVFSLSLGAVEWVVSAFLFGYVAGQLIYGPLANSFGRLWALKWGLNLNLLGLVVCLLAGFFYQFPLLILGRFITGLGSAAGLTCTFMLINEWLPEEQRKSALSYSILSFALGIGFAVLMGGLITQYINWQGCFVFLMLHGIIMRLGLKAFDETLRQPKPLRIATLLSGYGQALRSPQLVIFSLIWGACSAVGYCYSAAAPQIAQQFLNLTPSTYSYWNIINIGGMLLGGITARELLQRFSGVGVISCGYLGSGLAILSLIIMWILNSDWSWWFFISTALLYCFSSYLFAGASYMASNAIADKASAASMMSFINMMVATLSVVVMGYVSTNSFTGFILILSLILGITVVLLGWFQWKDSPSIDDKN